MAVERLSDAGHSADLAAQSRPTIAAARRRFAVSCIVLAGVLTAAACAAGSQDDAHYTIGIVTNNPNGLRNARGFMEAMTQLGYDEGDNATYLFSGEPHQGDELERVLRGFVAAEVDLIFTAGTPTGVAAHRITSGTGIPVVFGVIADPLAAGVMDDLNHPGGNMTGVKLGQHQDRRLELLLEVAPGIRRVFVPYNPDDAAAASAVAQIEVVAESLGVDLVLGEARSDVDVMELLATMPVDVHAIFLVPDSTVNRHLVEILATANARRIPTSGPSTAQVEEGALTTYGFIHEEAGAQAARIADQVLRGADPGDLPVEDTESFLAINLATAKRIGLAVPDTALQQAELIIREGVAQDVGP